MRKAVKPSNSFPYDNFCFTPIGEKIVLFDFPPTFTRSCALMSMVGSFEDAAVMGAKVANCSGDFYMNGFADLRLQIFKLKFMDHILSDALLISKLFRLWVRSSATRVDGKIKGNRPVLGNPIHSNKHELNNNSFYGCRPWALCTIDDAVAETKTQFSFTQDRNGRNISIKIAGMTQKEKEMVKRRSYILSNALP